MTRLRTARVVGAYADMLRQWGGGHDGIAGLVAPPPSILRDAAIACAEVAELMAQHLRSPAPEARCSARRTAMRFARLHDAFGRELRLAVRRAARFEP
jgi:hypothetical protein